MTVGDTTTSPVDDLGNTYLELAAAADPFFATSFGLPGHDDRVQDVSAAARAEFGRRTADLRDRAAALDPDALDDTGRASRALVVHDAGAAAEAVAARTTEWQLGGLVGPVSTVLGVCPKVVLSDPRRAADYAARCATLPGYLDASVAALRRGLADGLVTSRQGVRSAVGTIEGYLASPASADPLLAPLGAPAAAGVAAAVETAVADGVRPALARLRDMLRDELLPAALPDEACGVGNLPGGPEIYDRLVARHTTTARTAADLHETGLRLAEQLREEFRELGSRVLGTSDADEVRRRLREDPAVRYGSAAEILADAREAQRRAEEAVPDWFGRRHRIPCDIEPMNDAEAATSALGYYQPPAGDGSRPGRCWLNTSAPGTRFRHETESLTFHETVPGHHMQFAVARELGGLPAYRRFAYVTAYGEGWGLYTERLADEMGLYSTDLARFGMVSFDAWRAARLVVDTGLHAFGWSRQRAIDYMVDHTALDRHAIVPEVDRYISMPGQALAYMTGRLEIVRLREHARDALGAGFDLRGFHDTVLGSGSVPLSQLADDVERWIAAPAAG
ncbi:DUF885 domain-containing protein [Pseudonocardia sp. HH130630-07]|uniref:DUF885 domain-containing protein n=1 Tax=Pseudonocardia sp. HH130630-07 TaxID=1690815 RepID=UPI000814B57B|nr:DUF885 domain-containing protein [Pseudonocardia sp. HH130630-07]ANY09382.1 hypothetical protein AFB00_27605 [Pseudonocardia sp. HH130630-07]